MEESDKRLYPRCLRGNQELSCYTWANGRNVRVTGGGGEGEGKLP